MTSRVIAKRLGDLPTYGLGYNTGALLYSEDGSNYQIPMTNFLTASKSFDVGFTITSIKEEIVYDGQRLVWTGAYPKTVPSGSTPDTTGGIGSGAWAYSNDSVLRENLLSSEGGNLIGLNQGINVQETIRWTIPQAYGAKGDGVHDDTDALYSLFKSGYRDIKIPAGTYLISRKLKCVITSDINVVCESGVVFKLADNARCNMLVFVGTRENNFSWSGGEFDGNWDNQGAETLTTSGAFSDMSHGFIVSLFNQVRLDGLYVHSFRGHSINHAGNRKIHASNLKFNSHIAQAFPMGGSRGDGITGCSEDILIENVYGFTTDDMVAVFAGILWIEGGTESDSAMVTNLDYLTCKSVTIRNINPWKKYSDLDGTTEVYTWNGVVVGGQGGMGVEKIHISDVKGYTQYSGVRMGASDPVGQSSSTDYWNSLGSVFIDDISVRVAGTGTNQHLYNTVRIGSLTASSTGTAYQCVIKSLTLSNIQLWPTGNDRTLIGIGYTTIYNLNINNITVTGSITDDTYNIVRCTGDRQIAQLFIDGITHNPPTTSTDVVAQAQLSISWENTYPVASKLYLDNLPIRRNAGNTAYISNTFIATGATPPEIYGYSSIVRTASNFYVLPKTKGVHCRDRYLGKVRVDEVTGLWVFDDFSTIYDTTNYGRPSATNLIGYSNITWEPGMFVSTTGSPYGSVTGWLYNTDNNWQLISTPVTNNMVSIIAASSPATLIPPYVTITSPVYNDSTWPESYGQVTLYGGHPSNRATAYELFVSNTGNMYTRTWSTNTLAWNSWYRTPRVVEVPTSSTSSGSTGNMAVGGGYVYFCIGTNSWVRTAVSSW